MKLAEYVKEYRLKHKLSGRKFAEKVGCSNAYISYIESGKQTNFSTDFLASLAKAMNITLDKLLDDVDNMTADLRKRPPTEPVPDLSYMKSIPVLGASACGSPIEAIREYDYVEVDSAIHADFALKAEGRSMTGCGIMDGSLVLCQEAEMVENGQIAAVTIDNATTIKRFYRYGDVVVLKPCNPDYDEQEYSGSELDALHVFGRVVACLTKY